MAEEQDLLYLFKAACANYDICVPESILSLAKNLDALAVEFARSEELRSAV